MCLNIKKIEIINVKKQNKTKKSLKMFFLLWCQQGQWQQMISKKKMCLWYFIVLTPGTSMVSVTWEAINVLLHI